MRFSLLNRFEGGLLGGWIGASLITENDKSFQTNEQLLPAIQLSRNLTESIINLGQITNADHSIIVEQQAKLLNAKIFINSGVIALATLPLALFFHDDPSQFTEYLYSLNLVWKQSQETLDEVMLWQDAIALILREKSENCPLLPQLLKRHSNTSTLLWQQLEQVQSFLEEKISLQQAVSQLSYSGQLYPNAIALAFYCFNDTPQELGLCIKRAKQIYYQPSLTAALTGILAGVYNGVSGIPIAWRIRLHNDKIFQEIYRQATNLLAVWSGVDQPSSLQPLQHIAIASPLIIQSRRGFKMISQKNV